MKLRSEPTVVRRIEFGIGLLISVAVLVLVGIRLLHAGALWRDECAVVQLARLPSVRAILTNFPHEAFPPLFPILIRFWTCIFGDNDAALRVFGFIVASILVGAVWWTFRILRAGVPSVSLACIGLSSAFTIWGTSVRAYGIGTALILLVFGAVAALATQASRRTLVCVSLVSVLCAQVLVQNTVLLVVIILAGVAISIAQARWHDATSLCVVLILALLFFLPYVGPYVRAVKWSVVVQASEPPRGVLYQLGVALADVPVVLLLVFAICLLVIFLVAVRQVYLGSAVRSAINLNTLAFSLLVLLASPIVSAIFFRTLKYAEQPWYALAPLSLCAIAVDLTLATILQTTALRLTRAMLAVAAAVTLAWVNWPKLMERQTNIDIVARTLAKSAGNSDLIIVNPWQLGISFSRYYNGGTHWITVPQIEEHRIHRYDLVKSRMTSPQAIDDVLEIAGTALRSGNRVWIVGGVRVKPNGEPPVPLAPAPESRFGWDNVAYIRNWTERLGYFIQQHTEQGNLIELTNVPPVNPFERVPLVMAEGWKN